MYRQALRLLVLVTSLTAASVVCAQAGFTPEWAFHGAPEAATLHSSYVLQQLAYGPHLKSGGASASKSRPVPPANKFAQLTFDARAQPIAPAKLARAYPQDARAQVEQVFGQTLDGYRKIESQFGLPRNDLGGALAAFVAGSYSAYRNEAFPDRLFKPLAQQMQNALQSSGSLEKVSAAEKQELYENLAILGTYLALMREALQKSPDGKIAANMKTVARGYLEQALRLDPDRMRLTEQGLVLN